MLRITSLLKKLRKPDPELELEVASLIISVLSDRIPWVCTHDISIDEFQLRHKNVLETDVDPIIKGLYLSMMHYNNVLDSRGESENMVNFLGLDIDPYYFYCGRMEFFEVLHNHPDKILELFDADSKDTKVMKSNGWYSF